MNITFIIDTFIKAFYGVPVTLGIMIVAILLSFLPALFPVSYTHLTLPTKA